jgi:catalase-peroxidase
VNLLDMGTSGEVASKAKTSSKAATAQTGELKWTGTAVDLVFGSNSQLRAIAEVYAAADGQGEVRATTSSRPGTRS